MEILLTIIITILCLIAGKLFLSFRDKKSEEKGMNMILNHIYAQIKIKGHIDLLLDKEKITLVKKLEEPKK